MRLLTFKRAGEDTTRIGALTSMGKIIDLAAAYTLFLRDRGGGKNIETASADLFADMLVFIRAGEPAFKAAMAVIEYAEQLEHAETKGNSSKQPYERLLIDENEIDFLPPILHPGKMICAGMNYRDHLEETGRSVPEFPAALALAGANCWRNLCQTSFTH